MALKNNFTSNMEIQKNIQLFNNNIYKSKFIFDWDNIKNKCEELVNIEKQDYLEKNSFTSTFNETPPHALKEFENYYNFITPIYTDLLKNKWGFPADFEYEITRSFVSKFDKKGHIIEHIHSNNNNVMVICAYLQIKPQNGYIQFRDEYYIQKQNALKLSNSDDWLWKEIPTENNDVLFFQAGMWHRTTPNLLPIPRWTITTNIGIKTTKTLI